MREGEGEIIIYTVLIHFISLFVRIIIILNILVRCADMFINSHVRPPCIFFASGRAHVCSSTRRKTYKKKMSENRHKLNLRQQLERFVSFAT